MSYELIGILLLGVLLGAAELVTFAISIRMLREVTRMVEEVTRIQRAVAGLIVQESQKIQDLLRA